MPTLLDITQKLFGSTRAKRTAQQLTDQASDTTSLRYGTAQEDGEAESYVSILLDGGLTPADLYTRVEVKEGDRVACIRQGSTYVVISVQALVEQIDIAQEAAENAYEAATEAEEAAQTAESIASATNQYFWHDSRGAHISNGGAQTTSGVANAQMTASGMNLYDANGSLRASYNSSGTVIGNTSGVNTAVTASGLSIYDGAQTSANQLASFANGSMTLGNLANPHLSATSAGVSIEVPVPSGTHQSSPNKVEISSDGLRMYSSGDGTEQQVVYITGQNSALLYSSLTIQGGGHTLYFSTDSGAKLDNEDIVTGREISANLIEFTDGTRTYFQLAPYSGNTSISRTVIGSDGTLYIGSAICSSSGTLSNRGQYIISTNGTITYQANTGITSASVQHVYLVYPRFS